MYKFSYKFSKVYHGPQLPRTNDALDIIARFITWSVAQYWQVEMSDGDWEKTAFVHLMDFFSLWYPSACAMHLSAVAIMDACAVHLSTMELLCVYLITSWRTLKITYVATKR